MKCLFSRQPSLVWVAVLALMSSSGLPLRSQTLGQPPAKLAPMLFKWPAPPQDPGAPKGRRRGGAQRDDCATALPDRRGTDLPSPCLAIEALVPNIPKQAGWTLTALPQPTFWFYIEPAGVAQLPLVFVLQDQNRRLVYRTEVVLTSTQAGMIDIPLPTSVSLALNQRYTWSLWAADYPGGYTRGNIYRVPHPTPVTLETALANGLWQDALTQLALRRRQTPNPLDGQRQWQSLFQDAGLQALAPEPMLSCCGPETSAQPAQ